jgi:protein subunit release factor B
MMDSVCITVPAERRVSQVAKKQWQAAELIATLARLDPVYKEEEEEEEEMFKARMHWIRTLIRDAPVCDCCAAPKRRTRI